MGNYGVAIFLLLCVLFFSVWCVCPSLFFFFFCSFPLGFSQYTICSLFLLPFVLFSFPSPSPLVCSPARFFFLCFGPLFLGLPVFLSCSAMIPVQWLLKMELWSCYWRRSITVSPFVSLFSPFFLVLPPPLFSWLSLLSLRPFLSFVFFPGGLSLAFIKPEKVLCPCFQKRRASWRREIVGFKNSIVGIVVVICWIFPWPWSAGSSPVAPVFGKQMMNSRIQNDVIWHGKWQIVVSSLTFWNISIGPLIIKFLILPLIKFN